jgi:ABC-type nitrate/sulfonate/bicarbonate transport system substrate-binding protein
MRRTALGSLQGNPELTAAGTGVLLGRREFIRLGFGVVAAISVGDVLASCASAVTHVASSTPLPPPETKTIRLNFSTCDAPLMASEPYLRQEGFTDVQFSDISPQLVSLTTGKADIAVPFVASLAAAVDSGKPFIGFGPLHPGCVELWAPQSVSTLADLRGHTVVVNSKIPNFIANSFMFLALKNAGIDPSEVNFVVQPNADLTELFLEGKSDLLFQWGTGAVAFRANPANMGHIVLDQAMDATWSHEDCCVMTTSTDWLRANPIAAKRVLRAIYHAADSLPIDRLDAAKTATDKGLFGGAKNVQLVRGAANMVPYAWRKYDLSQSMLFHAQLMDSVGLLKLSPDEAVARAIDPRIAKELATELKR